MKKTATCLAVLAVFAATAWGGVIDKIARLGPAAASLVVWGNTASDASQGATIAAGGAGVRNCLSRLTVTSNASFTLRILDGSATSYVVDVATSAASAFGGGATFDDAFQDDQMCGSAATALSIKVSTQAVSGSASAQKVSYTGFTY